MTTMFQHMLQQSNQLQQQNSQMQHLQQQMVQMQKDQQVYNQQQLENMQRLATSLEKGKLPAQTIPNPEYMQSSLAGEQHKSCKAVTTLRSGKTIEKPDLLSTAQQGKELQNKEKNLEKEGLEEDKEELDERDWRAEIRDSTFGRTTVPYPERLINKGKDTVDQKEMYDVFSKCQVNLPLLTAIKQVPKYAKYLKELCTIKRKLHVRKKSFLAENVSAIVQNTVSKMSDPGPPTIPCTIGVTHIEHALLDLGSSVNLLPFYIFEEIGLWKLKPTPVTLQLADGSIVVPEGKIEDVIVKVQRFLFSCRFYCA